MYGSDKTILIVRYLCRLVAFIRNQFLIVSTFIVQTAFAAFCVTQILEYVECMAEWATPLPHNILL